MDTGNKISLYNYHGDTGGCGRQVAVEVGPPVVEVLSHVGEGFVAELTLVKGFRGVGLPARHQEEQTEETIRSCQLCVSHRFIGCCLLTPVHDESHLSGEAVATVHTQVPGHARVCAHVRLQRRQLLEHLSTLGALVRALLVYTLVSGQPVNGGERAVAELALLGLGTERHLLLCYSDPNVFRPLCRLVPPSHLLQATHNAWLAALFVLTQEVLSLVLEEVLWGLEEKGAFGALVRVDDHHLRLLLMLLLAVLLDTRDQPQLDPLDTVFQNPQLCPGA